ncbi:gas vesicle protein GvpJ [Amycolatopsis sp. NPDC051758]|uniref:gas vesicle protein GvpJ n=1 Tax=Amycolatopsis sp. NPDC051758 TaxID=3363935 RepID=UPI0037B35F60
MNDLPALAPDDAALTSLVDLLDRVVTRGAVVNGDVIITLAGIDLIRLDLRLLLAAVDELAE